MKDDFTATLDGAEGAARWQYNDNPPRSWPVVLRRFACPVCGAERFAQWHPVCVAPAHRDVYAMRLA